MINTRGLDSISLLPAIVTHAAILCPTLTHHHVDLTLNRRDLFPISGSQRKDLHQNFTHEQNPHGSPLPAAAQKHRRKVERVLQSPPRVLRGHNLRRRHL